MNLLCEKARQSREQTLRTMKRVIYFTPCTHRIIVWFKLNTSPTVTGLCTNNHE